MILDKTLQYFNQQPIRAIAETVSPDIIDEGVDHDIGVGTRVYFFAALDTEAAAGPATSRVAIHLETSDTADFATAYRVLSSVPVSVADLEKDGVFCKLLLPPGMRRYTRAVLSVTGAAFTAGNVHCSLTLAVDSRRNYPDRLSIVGRQ